MLILASASPRRKELLKKIGVDFKVVESHFDETAIANDISPQEYAIQCAAGKAEEVFVRTGGIVVGADTIVVAGGKILGKPKDNTQAKDMLMSISGHEHTVITGVCIINGDNVIKAHDMTSLFIDNLSDAEIDEYIASRSPFDKAGGYGIQDQVIKNKLKFINGSMDNVIGLPTELLLQLFSQLSL